jgi:hypothetical protein
MEIRIHFWNRQEPAGELDVLPARGGIATGVVVEGQGGGGAVAQGFPEELATEVFTEKQRNIPSLQGLSRIAMRSSAYTPPT